MNKRKVDTLLPAAVEVCKKHQLTHEFRGQISSFGSAVASGSLLAAVAFFGNKGRAAVDRRYLMIAIYSMMKWDTKGLIDSLMKKEQAERAAETDDEKKRAHEEKEKAIHKIMKDLFDQVNASDSLLDVKEEILCCAVAVKLALNLFPPEGGGDA